MANILYLVHRLPYPPNKGDKVRSFHLLKHLAQKHNIFLGTFVDDPDDLQYIDTVRSYCRDMHVVTLNPRMARLSSLSGLIAGDPLTLRYYQDGNLQNWVKQTCKNQPIDAAVVFCSAMAQYVDAIPRLPTLIDFVDVDSAKWTQYAPKHRWPLSWLYRREGQLLLAYERSVAARSTCSFFVTDSEAELFTHAAPECATRVKSMCNGVDAEYFSPDPLRASPYGKDEVPVVFTGAMDYLPNIDAVRWFAHDMLPDLLRRQPKIRFYIVGRSPSPEVIALAGEHVAVTGTVDDVRPYIQHAAVVVAPLRIARGIQNKILEAMAMGKPVVASSECATAVDAAAGQELIPANTPENFISEIETLLTDRNLSQRIGQAARQRVLSRYSWDAHLGSIDQYIPSCIPAKQ
jgi:sugar transferase (PEP-CTERM/EpsH1 system associated)